MSWELSRQEIKNIFTTSLKRVADFNSNDPDFEQKTFVNFHDFHKIIFLNDVKHIFNTTYKLYKGKKYCYNITLNENMINNWKTFGECINYLVNSQRILLIENHVSV